jgi:all-trans-8'-apo-beta-carotenal 15,15'-oxygenase
MKRREFLIAGGSALFSGTLLATTPSIFKSEFAAAVARDPRLTPFRGTAIDLNCEALSVEGKLPAELRGRFYRNGPANFERGNERYQHWFDGDGMVQQFTFTGSAVSHRGRLVRTSKLKAEQAAGKFLVPAFGTGIKPELRITGPDSMNTANTNAIEHAGRVLAMWEGGSAHDLDPATLETRGVVTWKEGWEQMPFSAHPKLDPQGNLWNFGNAGNALFVYQIDPRGKLVNTQMAKLPIDRKTAGGMSHDMAITDRFIIVPIPPVTLHFDLMAQGKTGADVMRIHKSEALRIWVAPKDDVSKAMIFELPHEMVFHVGNAYERTGMYGAEIVLNYVGSREDNFLAGAAVAIMRGEHAPGGRARMRTVTLNLSTNKATVTSFEDLPEEFPRLDPRFIGVKARYLVTPASWGAVSATDTNFHGVQVRDVESGKSTRFDYGDNFTVEEHIVVARPGSARELDGWIIGSAFDAKSQRTCVSVFDAANINNGPIARAWLPYWLPLGFHGNFTAA